MLSELGLPQHRERAIVIAATGDVPLRGLDDLWAGLRIRSEATTVRRAIGDLPVVEAGIEHPDDPMHVSTAFGNELSLARIQAIPHDGGSWPDLYRDEAKQHLLTPNMWRAIEKRRLNTHCDAYGRLAWDRPAPTIKRECCHVGNGRYSHPEQDRLCTIREISILQGFPRDVVISGRSRKNRYRQIGDAVPPLISFQLAHLCAWMLTDIKPEPEELLLPGTHLVPDDIEPVYQPLRLIVD
jgi:DNA (cytosine-5)-methyltransferase 1